MKYFGFNKKEEFLPHFDIFDTKEKQRRLFLNLYNLQVDKVLQIDTKEIACESPLCDIFLDHITNLKENSPKTSYELFSLIRGEECTLLFDADTLFREFVFHQVKKVNKEKNVTFAEGFHDIEIKGEDAMPAVVIPSWKMISRDALHIEQELNRGIAYITDNAFTDVFLVYPKGDNFDKHIPIIVPTLQNLDYNVKVVPYSMRKCLR